jgi:ketosteroid isomerase-like protein
VGVVMGTDRADVLAANQFFYNAFTSGDIKGMAKIWAEKAPVACAHPGAPLLVGREVVLDSWNSILDAKVRPEILCLDPLPHLLGETAYVTCYEQLGGNSGTILLATNVFTREGGAWRIVHHHAGPTPLRPRSGASSAADQVLH